MTRFVLFLWLALCHANSLYCSIITTKDSTRLSEWAYDILHIPELSLKNKDQILIAVIDDGFLLEHNSLSGFIYTNEKQNEDTT